MFGVSNSNELWISFKDELSAQEIKIDIVKSGTDIPVAGNYRFRWLDIDLYQRFGINLQNGSIGHRYATTDSVVNVVKKTLFSKNFEVLTAPAPAVDGELSMSWTIHPASIWQFCGLVAELILLKQQAGSKVYLLMYRLEPVKRLPDLTGMRKAMVR